MMCRLPLALILLLADSQATTTDSVSAGDTSASATVDADLPPAPAAGMGGLIIARGPDSAGGSGLMTVLVAALVGCAALAAAGFYYMSMQGGPRAMDYDIEDEFDGDLLEE